MVILRFVGLILASLLGVTTHASPPIVEEIEVEVAPGVAGTFAATPGQLPEAVVLLLHGWTGHRDEVGDMFKRTAAVLTAHGIASLRIDFRGEGERHGHRLTSTFAGRIADAEAALEFLQKRHPDTKIGVLGFSLGGATALALVGHQAEAVDSLALWSTAGDLAVDFFTNEALKPAMREALEMGEATYESWTTLTLTREHITGMVGYDLFTPLADYAGALLAIRGTADYVNNYDPRILAAANGSREEIVTIGNADHIFNTLDPASTHDERAIDLTVRWFNETLR
jgi:uncharacterized protein